MRLISIILFVLFAADQSYAGALSAPKLQINGGIAVPERPAAFERSYTIGFGGGVGFEVSAAMFDFMGTVDFTNFGLDKIDYLRATGMPEGTVVTGGEASTLYLSGSVKWNVLPQRITPIRPYVVGGGGVLRFASDDIQLDGELVARDTESVGAVHGGGGLDVTLGGVMRLFVEAIYVVGFTNSDNTAYIPIRAGFAFDVVPER